MQWILVQAAWLLLLLGLNRGTFQWLLEWYFYLLDSRYLTCPLALKIGLWVCRLVLCGGRASPVAYMVFRDWSASGRRQCRLALRSALCVSHHPSPDPVQGIVFLLSCLISCIFWLERPWGGRRVLFQQILHQIIYAQRKFTGCQSCVQKPGVTWICLYPSLFSLFLSSRWASIPAAGSHYLPRRISV